MIDYHMLRRMHPTKVMFQSDIDDLGTAAMKRDEPPSDEFLAVLPSDIHAFDFSRKAWSKPPFTDATCAPTNQVQS